MITNTQFDEAAKRLLGADLYGRLRQMNCPRPDMCKEVAQGAFIGSLSTYPGQEADLELIRGIALNLHREGILGIGISGEDYDRPIVNYTMPDQIIIFERGDREDARDTVFYLRIEMRGNVNLIELKESSDPFSAQEKAISRGYNPTHYMEFNAESPTAYP